MHAPQVAVLVVPAGLTEPKPAASRSAPTASALVTADLEQQAPPGAQQPGGVADHPGHHAEPVGAAVEGDPGLVALHVGAGAVAARRWARRAPPPSPRRTTPPRSGAPRSPRTAATPLRGRRPRPGGRCRRATTAAPGHEAARWAATAPQPVQRSAARAVRGQHGGGPAGQLLGVGPGDEHARVDHDRPSAEGGVPGDPGERLAALPAPHHRLEPVRGRRRPPDEHRGLVVGRDAPGRAEAAGHGGEGGVGAQVTGRGWCA